MAVEVVRGHNVAGSEILEKYPAGKNFDVSEGHLLVRGQASSSSKGKVIAAYAPTKWAFARYVEDQG